ncbi:MAG: hypothetical protein ACRDTG_19415 [Pseudonocardiaceae bacterium]
MTSAALVLSMVDTHTGESHLVPVEAVALHRRLGRYPALCGTEVPAASLDHIRRTGSHRVLAKDDLQRVWAYHDGVDLGGPAMARVAKDYGYTLAELRKL